MLEKGEVQGGRVWPQAAEIITEMKKWFSNCWYAHQVMLQILQHFNFIVSFFYVNQGSIHGDKQSQSVNRETQDCAAPEFGSKTIQHTIIYVHVWNALCVTSSVVIMKLYVLKNKTNINAAGGGWGGGGCLWNSHVTISWSKKKKGREPLLQVRHNHIRKTREEGGRRRRRHKTWSLDAQSIHRIGWTDRGEWPSLNSNNWFFYF